MSKTFVPVFKETESDNLLDHLGLTEAKADLFASKLNEAQPKNVVEALKVIAENSDTPEEYTLGVFVIGQHSAPNPLEAMLAGMGGPGGDGPIE